MKPVSKQSDLRKVQAELVGTSVGAAAAPTLSSIPFVGWVAAGWVAMFSGNQGANIGGGMAEQNLNQNCYMNRESTHKCVIILSMLE